MGKVDDQSFEEVLKGTICTGLYANLYQNFTRFLQDFTISCYNYLRQNLFRFVLEAEELPLEFDFQWPQ